MLETTSRRVPPVWLTPRSNSVSRCRALSSNLARPGVESVTITNGHLPRHNHPFQVAAAPATTTDPTGNLFGQQTVSGGFYSNDAASPSLAFESNAITAWGTGGEPVNNLMPGLTVTYIISLYGAFPQTF